MMFTPSKSTCGYIIMSTLKNMWNVDSDSIASRVESWLDNLPTPDRFHWYTLMSLENIHNCETSKLIEDVIVLLKTLSMHYPLFGIIMFNVFVSNKSKWISNWVCNNHTCFFSDTCPLWDQKEHIQNIPLLFHTTHSRKLIFKMTVLMIHFVLYRHLLSPLKQQY